MTTTRMNPHHESPRLVRPYQETSRLRRPASLTSPVGITQSHIRTHARGHSLGYVSSPQGYLPGGPFPPYHALPRDYRMTLTGASFSMGPQLHRGYSKAGRPPPTNRHGEKPKLREKQRSKAQVEKDKSQVEHSFITSSSEIAAMQDDLVKLQEEFNSGKLQAFDEECSFQKMDNIRDLQEKLARLHFKMDEELQAEGLHPTETIDVANQNMDHLLSNLDQLNIAIRSLHPAGETMVLPPDHRA